ncbi:MAG: Ubiquinone biosynthesis O-methyltransferase [Planctomycetes bacterium ADurb.Bin069]|nr:MAG: Ubiquinone biosynthesis O-methyltransferase [Planctomycetes bacterium ADurb.Bin069]
MRLRCPRCYGAYEAAADGRQGCASCGLNLFVPGGYAATAVSGPGGFDPGTAFEAMLDQAEREGWETAVRARPDLADWTLAPERAAGLYLTRIGRESAVLDYGCGFGSLSMAAAAMAKEVVALDAAEPFIRGTMIRAREAGISNLFPLRSDYRHLPFFDGTFDLVIVNGVLEYIPCQRPDRPPMETVRACIAALTRVLKPGGQLYLAIENRFGCNYLLGAKDEHSGLRFATVLPRPLAHLYSRLARARPYLTWTHSHRALRRLFAETGYDHVQVYAAFPNYRFPVCLVSLTDPAPLAFFAWGLIPGAGSLRRRIGVAAARAAVWTGIARLPAWRTLVPSFACVSTRAPAENGARPRWLDGKEPPAELYVKSRHGRISALLFKRGARQPRAVVNFTDGNNFAATEAALLTYFARRPGQAIDRWVLQPYARTASPAGEALYYRWQQGRGRKPSTADATAFLEALAAVELPPFLDTDVRDRTVAEKLGGLKGRGPEWAARYLAWVEGCDKAGRLRIVHGDLHAGNFVPAEDGFAVVDWEFAHRGSPWEDLFTFAVWRGRSGSAGRFVAAARAAADGFGGLAARLGSEREDLFAGLVTVGLRLILEARMDARRLEQAVRLLDRAAGVDPRREVPSGLGGLYS